MKPRSPYQNRERKSFWRTAVSGKSPSRLKDVAHGNLRLKSTDRIVTAGSCFAQHIAARLKDQGFNVLDYEPAPRRTTKEWQSQHGFGIYSGRYGNIYYVRQLLQLLLEAEGRFEPTNWIWQKGERFYDALRPGVEPDGCESPAEVRSQRQEHLTAVRRLIRDADVFVFTLGLTEGWEHVESGTVYPTAPGTIAGDWDPDQVVFHNFTFTEILEDLHQTMDVVMAVNSSVQFLFTVSPVALAATATDHNVLVANSYSKAVLRAVAGHVTQTVSNAHYFPSYDLITGTNGGGMLYESDQRSVHSTTVDFVMNRFMAEMLDGDLEGTSGVDAPESKAVPDTPVVDKRSPEQQICEDSLVEDFAP